MEAKVEKLGFTGFWSPRKHDTGISPVEELRQTSRFLIDYCVHRGEGSFHKTRSDLQEPSSLSRAATPSPLDSSFNVRSQTKANYLSCLLHSLQCYPLDFS